MTETDKQKIETFINKLVIFKYQINNEKQLKDHIRNIHMGECFNFIDATMVNYIVNKLLKYNFTAVDMSLHYFFTLMKKKIYMNFINARSFDFMQSLLWYVHDGNRTTQV